MSNQPTILKDVAQAGLAAWDGKPFLEKLTQVAPGVIYVFNQETQKNEYSNRSIGETLGYSVADLQALGSNMMSMLAHPDDMPRIISHMQLLHGLSDGEVATLEYRMKHRNGSWVWLMSYDTVFDRNADGSVLRHIGVAIDISDRKAAEDSAVAEKRASQSANEELRSFAYSVSHDMKSPSNTLKLLLSELNDVHGADLADDAKSLLKLSMDTVDRMQELIEEVLDYTRIVGKDAALTDVSLDDVLRRARNSLMGDIQTLDAQLSVVNLPRVIGHTSQLTLLFQNLLSNALKFRQDGHAPIIVVDCENSSEPGMVNIIVRDNGIGIAPENQDRIFEMFKRLHLREEYPGTGLGLALCQRVALNHGGAITVMSVVGKGSTFTVSLRRAS